MTGSRDIIELSVWAANSQLATLDLLREVPSVRIIALGGSSNEVRRFAEEHEIEFFDDSRQLARLASAAALIMDPETPMEDEVLQAMATAAALDDRRLFSLIPRPGLAEVEAELRGRDSRPIPVPCFSDTAAGRRFADAASSFGRPLTGAVDVTGAEGDALIHARLFDAIDTLAQWFGLPASVRAVAICDDQAANRPMRGLLAQLSYPDGRASSISIGTAPGALQRDVWLQGDAGRLAYNEGVTTWRGIDGRPLESGGGPAVVAPSLAHQIAEAVHWHLEGVVRPRDRDTWQGMMASCEAVLLSARTGNAETIDSVRRMLGRV